MQRIGKGILLERKHKTDFIRDTFYSRGIYRFIVK